jgi:hypothetical protein
VADPVPFPAPWRLRVSVAGARLGLLARRRPVRLTLVRRLSWVRLPLVRRLPLVYGLALVRRLALVLTRVLLPVRVP